MEIAIQTQRESLPTLVYEHHLLYPAYGCTPSQADQQPDKKYNNQMHGYLPSLRSVGA